MNELINFLQGRRIYILTPKVKSFSGDLKKLSQEIDDLGFSKIRINNKVMDIYQLCAIKNISSFVFDIDVVVDRITLTGESRIISQFLKSLSFALKHGDGTNVIIFVDFDTKEEFRFLMDINSIKNYL
ncbi:hypothetical protein DM790_25830 [Flavobacterium collinsii]|nr:hypothetical protein [Flavobacterium collinsii]